MLSGKSFTEKDLKFKLPFGLIISGPSSSGKTTFLLKFLNEYKDLVEPTPKSILYCYGEFHNQIAQIQKSGINVYSGVPSEELINSQPKPLLLILDDLMLNINERFLSELFTKKSHHGNIGIIFLTQNLFEKKIKVARANSQYIVIMRSPSHALQVRTLGTQIFPKQMDYFLQAYKSATSQSYGYIVIDLHASSDPLLRLRTNIFKGDEEKTLFIPANP